MTYDIQKLRNLTTGKLHTKMEDIYTVLEKISGEKGLTTTALGPVNKALKPYLQKVIKDKRFWDDKFDTSHTGSIDVPTLSGNDLKEFQDKVPAEIAAFWQRVS